MRVLPLVLFGPFAVAFLVLYVRGIGRTEREQREREIARRLAAYPTRAMSIAEFLAGAIRAAEEIQASIVRAAEVVRTATDAFARLGAAIAEQERRRNAVDVHDPAERV